jgi:hypothetical protein
MAHQDGFPDELVRAEERQGRLQSDGCPWGFAGSDALADAHRGEAVGERHQALRLVAAAAGRSVDLALGAQESAEHQSVPQERQVLEFQPEPCKPDVDRSEEQ